MDVMNCKSCGSLFNYIGGDKICPRCKEKLEEKFQQVKEFVRQNGRAGFEEISRECDVSTKQIKQWVREERLVFAEDSLITIECERCGAPIKSGRFCKQCAAGMTNSLNDAFGLNKKKEVVKKDREATRNRMRFLDN
ncbi:MAG: flagellar protein [Eubacterium sp.]|nr:flagellar protein [Eubacterium sp.]